MKLEHHYGAFYYLDGTHRLSIIPTNITTPSDFISGTMFRFHRLGDDKDKHELVLQRRIRWSDMAEFLRTEILHDVIGEWRRLR